MEKDSKEEARDKDPDDTKLARDKLGTKDIILLIVGREEVGEDEIDDEYDEEERHGLDEVIKPITGLIEWEVALMSHNGKQTGEENEEIELKGLQRDRSSRFMCEDLVGKESEGETTHKGRICLENQRRSKKGVQERRKKGEIRSLRRYRLTRRKEKSPEERK